MEMLVVIEIIVDKEGEEEEIPIILLSTTVAVKSIASFLTTFIIPSNLSQKSISCNF